MKIFVNITLLLILLAVIAAAITLPRQWTEQERSATAAAATSESLLLQADEPLEPSPDLPAPEAKSEPPLEPEAMIPDAPVVTPSGILDIVSKLQRGDSEEAALLINEALETLEDRDAIALQSIVSTDAARVEQIATLTAQLAETKEKLTEIERSSRKELDESLKTLATAIRKAEEATEEANKRSRELEKTIKEKSTKTRVAQTDPPTPKERIKLPENDLIDFSFGSTFLSPANKETLSQVVATLKKRSDIVVQLRGHTDTIGDPEYNSKLAAARCEMTRDFLTEQGVEDQRISIVSFGESQVFKDGVVAEKPRRVEILFRRTP